MLYNNEEQVTAWAMRLATSNVHNKLPVFKAIFLCLCAAFGMSRVVLHMCVSRLHEIKSGEVHFVKLL